MESTNTGGRRQRTSEEIIQLLNEFENSPGVTVKEFCEMQEISEAVNSCHVDPGFLHVDPPLVAAILLRA